MTALATIETTNEMAVMPVIDIGQAVERRNQIVEFVKAIMVPDTDYGTIEGTSKPTLLKPGAEKLTTFFGLSKRFEILKEVEDWGGDEPFFYYAYRCRLYRGDLLVAEGDGSCNSHEKKYRWREAKKKCPVCNGEFIIKGKTEYGGGWLCWKKQGGCGAKFDDGEEQIESQPSGRVPNPDIADQVNTIQKMAQKRALIAATLLAVNASEFFTQDLEDMAIIDIQPSEVEYVDTPEEKERKETERQEIIRREIEGRQDDRKANGTSTMNPQKLLKHLEEANGAPGYYQNVYHLYKGIKKVKGEFEWPDGNDTPKWREAFALAKEHALAHEAK